MKKKVLLISTILLCLILTTTFGGCLIKDFWIHIIGSDDTGCDAESMKHPMRYQATFPEQSSLSDEYIPFEISFHLSAHRSDVYKRNNAKISIGAFSYSEKKIDILEEVELYNDPRILVTDSTQEKGGDFFTINIQIPKESLLEIMDDESGKFEVDTKAYNTRRRRYFDYTINRRTNTVTIVPSNP